MKKHIMSIFMSIILSMVASCAFAEHWHATMTIQNCTSSELTLAAKGTGHLHDWEPLDGKKIPVNQTISQTMYVNTKTGRGHSGDLSLTFYSGAGLIGSATYSCSAPPSGAPDNMTCDFESPSIGIVTQDEGDHDVTVIATDDVMCPCCQSAKKK